MKTIAICGNPTKEQLQEVEGAKTIPITSDKNCEKISHRHVKNYIIDEMNLLMMNEVKVPNKIGR